ncbi:hypothetical protein QE358_001672 [Sphingomonas sp. SORGH_AS742]|nr:hypothetical protein [Sphingomonas sp. SORGH_AS_0742]
MHLRWAAVGLLAMLCAVPASAARPRKMAEERLIGWCIHRAAAGRPWLEKTLWGLRDQEGGWIGAAVRNLNGSYDLGPFQINSWWASKIASRLGHDERSVTYWLRYDPCFNADAARWIFLTMIRSGTPYWRAVGRYHSPTGWRQKQYVNSVVLHLRRRFGDQAFRP